MADIIKTDIPDLNTSWENYEGKKVEEFIRGQLKSLQVGKVGYLDKEQDSEGLTTLRLFGSEDSYKEWYGDRDKYASNVLAETEFYSSKPVASYVLKASVVKYPSTTSVSGAENLITINYNSYFDTPTDKDTENGLMTVTVNGLEVKELEQELVSSGDANGKNYSINIGDYLTSETNVVKITVKNSHDQSRTFTFNIQVLNLKLSFDANYVETTIRDGAWYLRVNCSGAEATVYCKITNGDLVETLTKTINNTSSEFIIDAKGTYDDGLHNIEVWAVNPEYNITTEPIRTSYIKKGSVSAIAISKDAPTSATQYSTIQVPYYLYLPDETPNSKVTVHIQVLYNGDSESKDLTDQEVTLDFNHSSGSDLITASVPLDLNEYSPSITLKIYIDKKIYVTHKVTVKSAGITLNPVDECKVYYSMKGRTNSDKGIDNLESYYNGVRTSYLVRSSNFKLNSYNGFLDGNGMTIGAGKTLTLTGWQPFAEDFGVNGTKSGRTIEIEFETGICSDENAVVVDCMDENTGFRIYANRIEVKCSATNVLTYYAESTRIKFSLSIDGSTTHTTNDLGGGNVSEADVNLGYLCINGVCVRMFNYSTAKWKQTNVKNLVIGSDQAQVILYSIRGYDKSINPYQACDNMAYDTPDVNDVYVNGVFDHYGKINMAKRNNILNSSGSVYKPDEIISYQKVKAALPNTPLIVWNIDELPSNKNNPDVPINGTTFENPTWNKETDGWATAPFTVGAHMFNADGTSSNGYPLPYKNWAEIFETSNGDSVNITVGIEEATETHTLYSITVGVETGEKEMVHKVNFASSEGIFNIHAMNMYQQILLSCAKNNNDLYSAYQYEQANTGKEVTYRKSLSGFPEVGFRRTSTSGSAAPTFLSIYNFINNKYSASFMGYPAKDYTKAQIWEVDENRNMFNQYIEDNKVEDGQIVQSVATKSSGPLYYARVPKKSPTNKSNKLGVASKTTDDIEASNNELAAIKKFHNWVVSTNVLLAERYKREHGSYETLASPVTYNNTTYRTDSPDYRLAKFTNEAEEYMKLDSIAFYFNFCQWIIGMDSMDKNMSIAFDTITWEE